MAFRPSASSEAQPRPGLKSKLAGRWKRLTGKAPGGASQWDQTAWQRAAADTSAFAAGRVWLFVLIGALFFGGAGGAVLPFDSILWRSLFGRARRPSRGRGSVARAHGLLLAPRAVQAARRGAGDDPRGERSAEPRVPPDYLRQTLDANTRILEELGKSGRTGPIPEDDDPWIRSQNQETKRQLEMLGFPDLVPEVVLDELQVGTWEGVTDDAKRISRRLANALADPRFHVLDLL